MPKEKIQNDHKLIPINRMFTRVLWIKNVVEIKDPAH